MKLTFVRRVSGLLTGLLATIALSSCQIGEQIDGREIKDRLIRNSRFFAVGLFAYFLFGCTINVYKNGETESSIDGETSQTPSAVAHDTGNTDSENDRTGTVSAASVMAISTTPSGALVSYDDSVALEVVLSVQAYVSCFYQQDDGHVIKLFPNRIIPLYRLESGEVLRIPGANGFRVLTSEAETSDSYMCLASSEDVTPDLPLIFQANTFQKIPVDNFDRLFDVYRKSTKNNLVARVLEVPVSQPAR